MTELESRTLARASILLLVAAGARWGWEARRPLPMLPVDSSGVLPRLMAEGEAARLDEELRARPLAEGETLDPNTASAAELDRLPGVGPATARAIVASRERDGPFRAPEDLARVRGVGAVTVRRAAPHLDLTSVPGGPVPSRSVPAGDPLAATGVEVTSAAPLDLNRATARELEGLPGIGPALAERIVALRRERGRFRNVDDLLQVRGIGPATLERLRGRVRAP